MQKWMLIVPSTVSKLLSELENNGGFQKRLWTLDLRSHANSPSSQNSLVAFDIL